MSQWWPDDWPDDWDRRTSGVDCRLCHSPGEESLKVYNGGVTDAYLQARTCVRGYCTVVWKAGHVVEVVDLPTDQAHAFWQDVLNVATAIRRTFSPLKLNVEILGNTVPHLHAHILPRYRADPAAGGPLPWELILGAEARPRAELASDCVLLRSALAQE